MKPLLRLRIYLRPYVGQMLLSLLILLTLTGLGMVTPAVIRQVIDIGIARAEVFFLVQMALLLLVIGLLRAVLAYFSRYLNEWIANHVGYDIRNRLYNHIQHLSFAYHDHSQTGQLISRCIEDARAVERFTGGSLIELIRITMMVIGITILLFSDNPRLAAIALLPVIPLILLSIDFGRRIGGFFYAVDSAQGDLSARLQENVSGVQVVRAFAREQHEIEQFGKFNRKVFNARVRANAEWSKIMPTSTVLIGLGTVLILWFGGEMVLRGEMTIGELVAFNGYVLMLAGPVGQLTWLVNAAGEAIAGARRTFEVLDTAPEIRSPDPALAAPLPPDAQIAGRVEFEHVSFNYQGESAHALNDLNVCVQPNQIVALIGATGSGKTSFVNLIPRFYDVSSGVVRVDGMDVRSLDLVWLRRQIGIVLQTSLLFSVSVRENIAYGRPEATLDEVVKAAQAAQADEFIRQLPQGYDTVVGERGITLSGGQRQRVAIARALLLNPRILILDDSTSSVDTQTERLIQKALDRLMEGRTTFVIAHRLSTVRRADLILVLEGGRIVERGTHHELLQQMGRYREIYDLQLRDQERFHEEMEALQRAQADDAQDAEPRRPGSGMKKEPVVE